VSGGLVDATEDLGFGETLIRMKLELLNVC